MTRDLMHVFGMVLAVSACASISPSVRQSFTKDGLDRAAFEMKCPNVFMMGAGWVANTAK